MEKTEQNARCSSKGAFDAASLLGCSTAATHTYEGLGRSELSDMISLKHGSPSSSHHCHMPQPRRIVEEMLGHIYARPPSAEGKAEQQVSGIQNSSSSPITKTASSVTSPSSVSGKLLRAKSSSLTSDSINSGKVSDKHVLDTSDSCVESGILPDSPSPVVMQPSSKNNSGKRRNSDTSLPDDVDNSVINSLHNSLSESGRKSDSSPRITSTLSQNGKDIKSKSHSGVKKGNELKRKKKQHRIEHQESGSDTDIQSNDSSTSSESAETSSSSCSVSDTTNSDSSEDEEDDAKRKRSLEELRKQQQELRKKVQELKQASQEAQALKQENQGKKNHSPKSSVPVAGNNNSAQPSPAHSGTSTVFSGSPCKGGPVVADTENVVLAPLDLCVKKLDPTADPTVLAGTVLFPVTSVSSATKLQSVVSVPVNMPSVTTALPIGQKRRGRKPKSLSQVPSLVDGQILTKQNKEIPSVLPSQVKTGSRRGRKRNANKVRKIERNPDFTPLVKTQLELDSANENSDSDDDTERSSTGNSSQIPSPKGIKRHYFEEAEGPQKKKRILPDEKDIRIPLEHGWRRQTKIRCFSRSGVRGEVTYFAPCGKKLRNYPEVVRYIQRHGITDISRENFTFSTKINVGEFIEHAQGGGAEDYVLVSEQEVMARIEEVRARKGRLGVQGRRSCIQRDDDEQQNHWEEVHPQHSEANEEAKRQKEHHRTARQQERFGRLEQLRIEREVRAQQMLEEMQKRREMLIMVDLERERRRQHMLLVRALEARKKQEEKERKREEILYEKRLNREKKLEQRRVELQMIREMKKPVEDMCLKDNTPLPTLNRIPGVKLAGKAFADMMMVFEFLHNFGETLGFDMENLPTLNTLQMALLNHDDKCEEELLSVIHHLLVCVINDPGVSHCPEAVSVLGQNLRDVDIANNNVSEVLRLYLIAVNRNSNMCQWLKQRPFLALNPMQKAEILAFLCNELLCSRRIIRQIDNSIEAVNSLRKDKWIVEGELRKLRCVQQRRAHTNYIKQCVAEDMKAQELSLQKSEQKNNEPSSELETNATKEKLSRSKKDKDGTLEETDAGVGNESGNESDETQGTGHISEAESEDTTMSNDELSKKIERLNKQLTQYQNKLTKACHTIRATTFGQDRYRRRYWVLPYSGGIFVEGRESVDPEVEKTEDMYTNTNSKGKTALKSVVAEKSSVKLNSEVDQANESKESPNVNCIETEIKEEEEEDVDKKKRVKEEDVSPSEHKEEHLAISDTNKFCGEWMTHKKSLSPVSNDILSPFADQCIKSNEKLSNSKLLNSQENDVKLPPSSFLPGDQNWFLQSPFFASILAGSMLFNGPMMHGRELNGSYFNFPKGDSSVQDNSFSSFLGFPPGLLPPEQIAKEQESASNQSKPWFSILPRMPCEHNSLTASTVSEGDKMPSNTHSISQLTSVSSIASTSEGSCTKTTHSQGIVSGISSLNSNPNPAAIANLHMDILNGIPPNFFMHPFLTPQPFGPTYQNNPSLSSTPHHSTGTSGTTNNLLFSGSDFLPNLCNPNLPLATSSTPSSIPTPSATPGPSYGSAPSSQRETPSPSFCRKYMIDKHEQYDKPQPIPPEFERGWWRITDSEQLKALLNTLHPRGIREKMLQKQFQKLFTYACSSCSKENREATDLEITDLDREISQKLGGAPEPNAEDEWSPEVALRVDMSVLEHVEAMEEKVASASMQVKGWKLQNKMSNDSSYIFYPACDTKPDSADEHQPQSDINETDHSNNTQAESNSEHDNSLHENDRLNQSDTEESSIKMEDDSDERTGEYKSEVTSASSNKKYINPVEAAKERLLLLEAAIERRYLRAPLGTNNELKLCAASTGKSQNIEKDEDNDIPIGLLRWRDAVQISKTSAQLAMCINLLEACIAWDKSIMRASCQFCHSGDNEEMLLLCDGCDKGYHTYCFKPKMETIPDGDWYCYECLSKVTGEEVCVLCGKKGKLLSCDGCPKKFHITCLEPPLSKMPKGKWSCSGCNVGKPSKKTTKQKLSTKEKDKDNKDKETPSKKSDSSKSKSAEKREKSKLNKDLSICTIVLDELEKREDAWPFLLPVNTKQFPTYRKIIKKPMDLSTMRNKLENGIYKTRDEVVSDARLIFDNCETFNEDDSPVGQAGHTMRAFFECRWSDLTST